MVEQGRGPAKRKMDGDGHICVLELDLPPIIKPQNCVRMLLRGLGLQTWDCQGMRTL